MVSHIFLVYKSLQTLTREARILKLYEELQKLKFNHRNTTVEKSGNDVILHHREMRKFLLIDYGLSSHLQCHRSNLELNRFLHESVEYEMCTRVKSLYQHPSRREKALENLRQKFYYNTAPTQQYR